MLVSRSFLRRNNNIVRTFVSGETTTYSDLERGRPTTKAVLRYHWYSVSVVVAHECCRCASRPTVRAAPLSNVVEQAPNVAEPWLCVATGAIANHGSSSLCSLSVQLIL